MKKLKCYTVSSLERKRNMELSWMGEHRELIEKIIKFGNAYTFCYKAQLDYNTDMVFSAAQIQTLEYILESEEKNEKMSDMAQRLGVSKSTFSRNVKTLTEKGLLERYQKGDNKKNIYVKPSEKGRQIYEKYTECALDVCFREMFSIADRISAEDKKHIGELLDCFSDCWSSYCMEKSERPSFVKLEDDE